MIYQQSSVIINTEIEKSWTILQKALTSCDNFSIFPGCLFIDFVSSVDGKHTRILNFTDRTEEEVVSVNFHHYNITTTVNNNPNYIGETSYHLLKPADIFLAEKHCTLVIVSAWRMLPGVFAAPIIDKQKYINSIAKNLKNEIENN